MDQKHIDGLKAVFQTLNKKDRVAFANAITTTRPGRMRYLEENPGKIPENLLCAFKNNGAFSSRDINAILS